MQTETKGGGRLKITLEHIPDQELEVVLRGDTESKEARQVLATLNHAPSFGKLVLQNEDESFLVDPADIRYFALRTRSRSEQQGVHPDQQKHRRQYQLCPVHRRRIQWQLHRPAEGQR